MLLPVAGLTLIASGFMAWSTPLVYDPLLPRLALGGVGLGLGVVGFVRPRVDLGLWAWAWGLVTTLWFQWVAYRHALTVDDVIGLLVIVTVSAALCRAPFQVALLLAAVAAGWIGFATVADPQFSPSLAAMLLGLAAGALGGLSVGRHQLLESLEQRVHERTNALQDSLTLLQREVHERKRAELNAERASQAKSRFLETMSHELRTPLTAVLGYTELIAEELEDLDPPVGLEDLERVEGAAEHLLALIDQMLDLTRIESAALEVDEVRFEIGPVLDEALAFIGGTGLEVEIEPGLEAVGDPVRLRQVLVDLLDNARKFSPVEAPVRVRAARGPAGPVVEVRDQGIGIAADDHERIFERFVQLDASSTRTRGGAGLGLSVARELMHAMGGSLDLESEPQVGSTFRVTLREAPA